MLTNRRHVSCWALLLLLPSLCATAATIGNSDRNFHIRLQDVLEFQNGTRLLYFTMPDITQAHAREKCSTNFYTVDLKPGLADTQPQILAENFCAYSGMSASITTTGDVIIVANDRIETWRPGAGKIRAWSLPFEFHWLDRRPTCPGVFQDA